MTRFLTLIAAFTLALLAQAYAADKVTYILDWLPGGDEAYPFIAKNEGLFAKEGLDVTIAIGRGASDVIAKMSAGTAEFGSGGISALFTGVAEHQVPVKAILSVFSKQPDAIFVVKGGPDHKNRRPQRAKPSPPHRSRHPACCGRWSPARTGSIQTASTC